MFRKNQKHLQPPLFSTIASLPEKQQKRLKASWADTFYQEIFMRIEELDFEILYSDSPSRPNVPVNVLVGLEILKAGFNWTDKEMYDNFSYNMQVRYALGYHNLEEGHFEIRTTYNFRNRLSSHMQETGENLFEICFAKITDEQMEAYAIKSGTQRTDSKQIASNIRKMSRLQLLIEVMQRTYRMLEASDKIEYHSEFEQYIKEKSGRYLYGLKGDKHQPHIKKIGKVMHRLVSELAAKYEEDPAFAVLQRVFNEHFIIEEKEIRAKEGGELSADSLQSPDDLEATFRKKRNEEYIGYVTNITETADPDNELQLILKVQTEANTTDDGTMLAEALPELVERTDLKEMYSDGGYNSTQVDNVCHDEEVELIQTAIRGKTPSKEQVNLEDFTFIMNENGEPAQIICPQGQTVAVEKGSKEGRFKATFIEPECAICDLLAQCQMNTLKRQPQKRRLYFTLEQIRVAQRRQRMKQEKKSGRNLRSAVEATVREISCRLGHGRLRVRGKFRVEMTMIASAAMANGRRIWRYQQAQKIAERKQLSVQNEQNRGVFVKTTSLLHLTKRIWGKMSFFAHSSTFGARLQNLRIVF